MGILFLLFYFLLPVWNAFVLATTPAAILVPVVNVKLKVT